MCGQGGASKRCCQSHCDCCWRFPGLQFDTEVLTREEEDLPNCAAVRAHSDIDGILNSDSAYPASTKSPPL